MTPADEALRLAQTPRSDEAVQRGKLWHAGWYTELNEWVPVAVSRELERELNALLAERERLQEKLDATVDIVATGERRSADFHRERAKAAKAEAERLQGENDEKDAEVARLYEKATMAAQRADDNKAKAERLRRELEQARKAK